MTSSNFSITQQQYANLIADAKSYIIVSGLSTGIYSATKLSDYSSYFFSMSKEDTPYIMRIYGPGAGSNAYDGYIFNSAFQKTTYKKTSISASSTDAQYPSAKAAYTYGQTVLTEAKSYTDTAIANAITTTLNTPV